MVPRLAPLIQQEIIVRLLTGPHGPRLHHLVMAGPQANRLQMCRLAQAEFRPTAAGRWIICATRAHESIYVSAALPRSHGRESTAVPEAIAFTRGAAADAEREPRRGERRRACGVRKPFAIQLRVQSPLRRAASARRHARLRIRSWFWSTARRGSRRAGASSTASGTTLRRQSTGRSLVSSG